VGIPVWSPDGARVAIAAEEYTTKAQSVIVREVRGKAAEFAAPPEAGGGLSFAWEDSTIRIKTANGEWKLQPDKAGSLVWFRMK
jgi:acetyl-CoA carboxylase carboxyltransferase component